MESTGAVWDIIASNMARTANLLGLLGGMFCAVIASAQDPIRVQVNDVIVPVTVTNDKGKFVSDLNKEDFHVFDQGKAQTIEFFTRERNQPVVIGFLMDLSNASKIQWKNYQDAATDLVYTLLPGDKKYSGYLIGYSTEAEVMVNTTSNSEPIVEKLKKIKPGGGSALYDAIYQACTNRKLVPGEPVEPRRIVIIVGDGHDNASKQTLDEVVELAQRNQVTIFGLSTTAFGSTSDGDANLVRLAQQTGGTVEYPLQNVYKDVSGYLQVPKDTGNFVYDVGTGGYASAISSSIFTAINHIVGEITTQYILRYRPDIGPGSTRQFRELKVQVDLPNVIVRARPGYYPFSP
jgi:Ca-activated chloride channel family protein